jgi:hypothetical protein
MGRATMIPAFVGDNIEGVLNGGKDTQWEKLPAQIAKYGQTPEQIFITYSTLQKKYGKRMKDIPLGAVAMYTFIDKLQTGLTQLMAGARSFRIDTLQRTDLMSLTEECAKVSGIAYVMDAYREEAMQILNGKGRL